MKTSEVLKKITPHVTTVSLVRVAPTFVLKYNIRTRSLADQRDRGRTGRRG